MKAVPLALVATFAGTTAFAQSPGEAADQQRAVVAAQVTAAAAVVSNAVVDVAPAFVLEASTKNDVASGQIGFQLRSWSLTVGASAPVGDTSSTRTLADLDGLRNKASGNAALIWSHWSIPDVASALTDACTAYAAEMAAATAGCTYLEIKRLSESGDPAAKAALKTIREHVKRGTVVFGGVRGKVAPEKFNFLNRSDLTAASEAHTSWSGSALAGLLFEDGLMISAAYTRQMVYEAGDQSQICESAGTPGAFQCDNHVVGRPTRERANQASVEIRKALGGSFAVSPKATYDWRRNVTGIVVPFYLLKSPAGGLSGGIALGWRSDTRALTASVFVGQVLSLITRD